MEALSIQDFAIYRATLASKPIVLALSSRQIRIMEPLSFLKLLWRLPITTTSSGIAATTPEVTRSSTSETDDELDEEGDSFFELELDLPYHDNNSDSDDESDLQTIFKPDNDVKLTSSNNDSTNATTSPLSHFISPPLSLSPSPSNNLFLRRKIIPIEPTSSLPQSPMSLLKSPTKLRVFLFKKSKPQKTTEKTEETEVKNKGRQSGLFAIKFKVKRVEETKLTKSDDASCNTGGRPLQCRGTENSLSDESTSKRFSKDTLRRYLSLVRPSYPIGASKRHDVDREDCYHSPSGRTVASPSTVGSPRLGKKLGSSPSVVGFRVWSSKHPRKSKSAPSLSAMKGTMVSSPARRDDSLAHQHDGIQSAILHCMRSGASN